jgi:ketosteroid isomerase-like protein
VKWEAYRQGEFSVEPFVKPARGTDVILHLRDDAKEFLKSWRLRDVVKRYSDYIEHPIVMEEDGKEQTFYSRSAHFLEKRGGEWKVVSDAGGGALDDAGQLLYMEMEWSDADQRGDTAWFERNLTEDYYGVSSRTGKRTTKADEVADLKNRKDKIESAVASDMQVRVEGRTGVVSGIYHMKGRDEKGQPIDRHIRYTDIFIKKDGRWQVITSHGTTIQQ